MISWWVVAGEVIIGAVTLSLGLRLVPGFAFGIAFQMIVTNLAWRSVYGRD